MPADYTPSRLIETFIVDRDFLSDAFVNYDTKYWRFDIFPKGTSVQKVSRYYTLPEGKLIVLLLLTRRGYLWTTIRRYTPSKQGYYHGLIGSEFDIEIIEGD